MEILDACSNSLVDIEDVWKDPEVIPVGSSSSAANSFSSDQRKRTAEKPVLSFRNRNTCIDKAEHLELLADSFIPGTHSIFVKTWGCSHNSSDSEYMAGQLASCGYNITDSKNDAHLWLLNSCTVKTPAEQHLQNMITDAYALGKCVVVAGCVPQAAPKTEWLQKLSIVGVQQIDRIVEVVEETLKGNSVRLLDFQRAKAGASLKLPKIRKNALIEILAINSGCLNRCTYCKTKHSRGNLASYPIHELVDRAKQSFDEGCREIWLTSEDLGAYGRDIGVALPDLLKELVAIIPQNAMMRLGMTNPPYILDHLDEIAEILRHPRVYAFLHIPVQSGSDAVLRAMKREYTSADFCRVVDFIRASVPGANVATDLIVGFPTETKEDFDETLHIIDKYRFTSLFTNQFYPRPGTPAAKMKRLDTTEVKRRTKAVTDLFRSYKPYEARIGAIYDVLVTEVAADGVHFVGHNKYYEQVLVPKIADIMGSFVTVEIVSATKHSMEGRLIAKADVNCNFDVRNHVPAKGIVSGIEAYRRFIASNPTLSPSKPLVPEKSNRLEMTRFRNLLVDYATSRSSVVIACIVPVLLAVVYKLVFKHMVW